MIQNHEFDETTAGPVMNEAGDDGLKKYFQKVYLTMGVGLGVTALVAALLYLELSMNNHVVMTMMSTPAVAWGLLIAQLVVVIVLSARITKMSSGAASILFYVYAALTGVTFSILPYAYGLGTVTEAFVYSAILYVSCALIGYNTKRDLSKFGSIAMAGLFTLIVITFVGFFVPSIGNSIYLSYAGVIIFVILTAVDSNKLKKLYYQIGAENPERLGSAAVYGALELYLDFINLFLYVLKILARSNGSSSSSSKSRF
jgi:FtsH-binding integral membrane protein